MSGGERLTSFLAPTFFLNCDHPAVRDFAQRASRGAMTQRDKAIRLYDAVRDEIWYDPYCVVADRRAYQASAILAAPSAFCVQKAIVFVAAARAIGIPSRLAFADVRNHLTSEKLLAAMGTDVFAFHGYGEVSLDGRWLKATPTFNRELCGRFGVVPLDFDGHTDAIFHPYDASGRRHMEYIRYRGSFEDFPLEEMLSVLRDTYGARLIDGESDHLNRDRVFAR